MIKLYKKRKAKILVKVNYFKNHKFKRIFQKENSINIFLIIQFIFRINSIKILTEAI